LSNGPPDTAAIERIGGAAGRALDEARRAISALTRPLDEPFGRVLQQVAEDLGSRYDVKVVVSAVDAEAEVKAEHGEALIRIMAEAVRNGVRHGGATQIDVALTTHPLRMAITDDGKGFASTSVRTHTGGFGLTSMRERARAIGAEFSITSTVGQGTTVEVTRG
jgi:signal transduction histidine kinase